MFSLFRNRSFATPVFLGLALFGLAQCAAPSRAQSARSTSLRELWVLPHAGLSPADQVLAQCLQGLTGRKQPRIWLRFRGMYALLEAQLKEEGVQLHEAASPWELLERFRPAVKGAVIYQLGTPSVNRATSLAGVLDAVAVEAGQVERAKALGLPILADARKMTEREVLERYRGRFARGLVVEQKPERAGFLRDFAVKHRAFTYYTEDNALRGEILKAMGPNVQVFGWGPDEHGWVRSVSSANATVVPADWNVNLSALESLPARSLRRPRRPVPRPEAGARYVAFVLTDGDNIQWLCGGHPTDRSFWANPLRGTFPMTWEVSPLLAQRAPRVLEYLYRTASPQDGFVTGAGLPGYTFAHRQTDRVALARQAGPLLRKADLDLGGVLNENEGDMSEVFPLLERPEVRGLLYKSWAPYHRLNGELRWHRGKPVLAFHSLLWEGLMEPEETARRIAALPADPLKDPRSYVLVSVHAWSYRKDGGPLEAIRRTIEKLPPDTRVITADQMLEMLRRQFAPSSD